MTPKIKLPEVSMTLWNKTVINQGIQFVFNFVGVGCTDVLFFVLTIYFRIIISIGLNQEKKETYGTCNFTILINIIAPYPLTDKGAGFYK